MIENIHITYTDCAFVLSVVYFKYHMSKYIPILFSQYGLLLSFSRESRACNINSQLNEDGGSVKDAVNKTSNFHIFRSLTDCVWIAVCEKHHPVSVI